MKHLHKHHHKHTKHAHKHHIKHYKHHHHKEHHHNKTPFKNTKFGHWLWRTGDNVKHLGEGIGKEALGVLHTAENIGTNLGKGVGGIGQGVGGALTILSNPIVLVAIGGIVIYKVIL